jgi:hypothetical protein
MHYHVKEADVIASVSSYVVPAVLSFIAIAFVYLLGRRHPLANRNLEGNQSEAVPGISRTDETLARASPDVAKKKIDELQALVNSTIGLRWEPLTPDKIESLSATLRELEISRAESKKLIIIKYKNELGKELAKSIQKALNAAGWGTNCQMEHGIFPAGINIGAPATYEEIGEISGAIEKSTGLKIGSETAALAYRGMAVTIIVGMRTI